MFVNFFIKLVVVLSVKPDLVFAIKHNCFYVTFVSDVFFSIFWSKQHIFDC